MEFDYSWDYGGTAPYDNWSWDAGATTPGAWDLFTGWGGDETQMPWYQGAQLDTGGGGGFGSILGSLGGAVGGLGGLLGGNASWLGPAASALGGLGAGALGANASNNAAAMQAAALNRGIDLQTAQWVQQQANQAPWLEHGREALAHLGGIAIAGQPAAFQPGATISGAGYALPSVTPGWSPQLYAGYTPTDVPSAAGYRYTPGQGPSAAQYRYTPGQTPDAAAYRYTPGALPTLSGAQLLANDPGVQFRLDEGRRALEASAAARGGLTSGATLAALQRQGQELSSQEYANAWQRAAQQAQMREGWQQQATAQNFGQALSAAQLREQVHQIASSQGWSQAQAEAAFREQLAGQASSQNWGQAAQEAQMRAQQQQFGWNAGMAAQQQESREAQAYDTDLYQRQWQQNQLQYGRDWAQNIEDYQRQLAAYNSQQQGQNTLWNRWAGLAGLGQTAVGQLGQGGQAATNQLSTLLGQLGSAQGQGALSQGNAWMNALHNVGGAVQGGLANQQLLSVLGSLNR